MCPVKPDDPKGGGKNVSIPKEKEEKKEKKAKEKK
jgi:hypothetical protein